MWAPRQSDCHHLWGSLRDSSQEYTRHSAAGHRVGPVGLILIVLGGETASDHAAGDLGGLGHTWRARMMPAFLPAFSFSAR